MIYAFAITGPTASGKTSLSLEIAKLYNCEIICLDSMQIYKKMDIGTAKATEEEQRQVKHHMLDFLSPAETFSAKAYKEMAMKCAIDISSSNKTPLFVGGTGLYLSTLIRPDCEEAPESKAEYREKIEKTLDSEEKKIALHKRLKSIDPEAAEQIHYNNTRRVIRALEIFDATGKTKTYFDKLSKAKNDKIEITHLTLDFHNRENLYDRVNKRVDQMIQLGLFVEVESLLKDGFLSKDSTAGQAIGYKEIVESILGKTSKEEAVDNIKQATRNYAKRQLTWFRNMNDTNTVYMDNPDGTMRTKDEILNECKQIFSKGKD